MKKDNKAVKMNLTISLILLIALLFVSTVLTKAISKPIFGSKDVGIPIGTTTPITDVKLELMSATTSFSTVPLIDDEPTTMMTKIDDVRRTEVTIPNVNTIIVPTIIAETTTDVSPIIDSKDYNFIQDLLSKMIHVMWFIPITLLGLVCLIYMCLMNKKLKKLNQLFRITNRQLTEYQQVQLRPNLREDGRLPRFCDPTDSEGYSIPQSPSPNSLPPPPPHIPTVLTTFRS